MTASASPADRSNGNTGTPVTAELDDLAHVPLAEHAARYRRIHEQLQEALAAIDTD